VHERDLERLKTRPAPGARRERMAPNGGIPGSAESGAPAPLPGPPAVRGRSRDELIRALDGWCGVTPASTRPTNARCWTRWRPLSSAFGNASGISTPRRSWSGNGSRIHARLPVAQVEPAGLQALAWSLAKRYNRPRVYDAQYLAIASSPGCELWTADQRLANAVAEPWVRLV
jgi:hypothetical protein